MQEAVPLRLPGCAMSDARQNIVDFALRNEPEFPCDQDGHGLYAQGEYEAHVNELLDTYAHELAEKQREAAKGRFAASSWATWWRRKSWLEAADLIDPEVST